MRKEKILLKKLYKYIIRHKKYIEITHCELNISKYYLNDTRDIYEYNKIIIDKKIKKWIQKLTMYVENNMLFSYYVDDNSEDMVVPDYSPNSYSQFPLRNLTKEEVNFTDMIWLAFSDLNQIYDIKDIIFKGSKYEFFYFDPVEYIFSIENPNLKMKYLCKYIKFLKYSKEK